MEQSMTSETTIETTQIPGTEFAPSRVGLGTWAIGGWMWGGSNAAQSVRTIQSAVDRSITLIDTAPVYGFGRSEEIVGKALAEGGRRAKVVIATKVGLDWKNDQPFRNASRGRIMQETAGTLKDMLEAGKIRAIGVSNFSPAQMDAFRAVAPLATNQPPFNLFERE